MDPNSGRLYTEGQMVGLSDDERARLVRLEGRPEDVQRISDAVKRLNRAERRAANRKAGLRRDSGPDDRPTRAQVDREEHDAANLPPDPPLVRHGHRVVGFLRHEPVDHLAFDSVTTLCGQPFETRVVAQGRARALCGDCVRAVGT